MINTILKLKEHVSQSTLMNFYNKIILFINTKFSEIVKRIKFSLNETASVLYSDVVFSQVCCMLPYCEFYTLVVVICVNMYYR